MAIPFGGYAPLSHVIEEREASLARAVFDLPPDEVLARPTDELVERLAPAFEIYIPPLGEPRVDTETPRMVDGPAPRGYDIRSDSKTVSTKRCAINVIFDFSGTPEALTHPPLGRQQSRDGVLVLGHSIRCRYDAVFPVDQDLLREWIAESRNWLDATLDQSRGIAEPWNARFRTRCRSLIEDQRRDLEANRRAIESLGLQLIRRPEADDLAVPVVRKSLGLTDARGRFLHISAYEQILASISAMGLAIERSPTAFARMKETELRDLSLVLLNGRFEGEMTATGETFNYRGKTDILVRHGDQDVFVAEYKIWRGPKTVASALEQLIGLYLKWRDTKAALVLFNRAQDHGAALDSIVPALRSRPEFKALVWENREDGRFRCTLRALSDANKEIMLTVLLFHIPLGSN
jgi:hypothetical protein